jgi:hypothetical protein
LPEAPLNNGEKQSGPLGNPIRFLITPRTRIGRRSLVVPWAHRREIPLWKSHRYG